MADLKLTLAMADYDRTAALRDGSVKPAGINLTYVVSSPSETFWRMLKFDEFDAAEMSLSSFLISRGQGRAWTAIPVFPFRAFFHTYVVVRADSEIRQPRDLAGARFGLPEYQMTAAVWTRGVLEHEFGVPPPDIRWHVERGPALSHGGQTRFEPPKGVSIEGVRDGKSLFSLLVSGELDAVMPTPYPGMTSMLDKTNVIDLTRSPHVRLLFPDIVGEGVRYFRKHGYSHINHVVIVQDRILKEHPWVAQNLFRAFAQAKQQCYARMDYLLRSSVMNALGVLEAQRQTYGDDPFPYGLGQNLPVVQTLADYGFEQGLLRDPVAAESIFAAATRDL